MARNRIAAKELTVLSGDQKLVERCLQGDDAAWELVVNSLREAYL